MKKFLAILLSLIIAVSMVACGNNETENNNDSDAVEPTATAEATTEPTEEPTTEPTPTVTETAQPATEQTGTVAIAGTEKDNENYWAENRPGQFAELGVTYDTYYINSDDTSLKIPGTVNYDYYERSASKTNPGYDDAYIEVTFTYQAGELDPINLSTYIQDYYKPFEEATYLNNVKVDMVLNNKYSGSWIGEEEVWNIGIGVFYKNIPSGYDGAMLIYSPVVDGQEDFADEAVIFRLK